MNVKKLYRLSFICLCVLFFGAGQLGAQNSSNDTEELFTLEKGTLLSGFSLDWTNAERDDYNHEFERAFSRMRLNVEGLYFLSDQIGAGPIIGYQYTYRDFEDPSGFFDPDDQWQWSFEYGVRAGWYAPVKEIFKALTPGNFHLFVSGGVSWLWSRQKTESLGKFDPNNHFGYQLSTGLLMPMGRQIALEGKLGWEARQRRYVVNFLDQNGQLIKRIDENKWLKTLSLGIGLKVMF